jgi:hypothetical protein
VTKPSITAIALGALVASGLAAGDTAARAETRDVIELFTSQGCSSCPPADRLLGEYADRDGVLALSFNTEIWDWLGWKDTLARPENTDRHRAYARALGGPVYTPEAVINGRVHVTGSSRGQIEAALQKHTGQLSVPIGLTTSGMAVTVSVGAAPAGETRHATLWLVMYDRSATVAIERGENTGRTITYSNVVRKLRPIEMWKGEAMEVDLPKSEIANAKAERCAVLLQAELEGGLPGPILGAATLTMDAGI